ncbi:hypothetical protein AOL_s00091g12 [Orbilia oligospora ATCC 24927]|uniref:Fungal N-terminal domain-containing protein n=1 Tax=Arthrobotrys oligospora (strain ATCC 24927 / CBS 115.81 / DSM 1491) TaxID=756982 RepID=G1XHW0_ARTOA|nr:hypothetical protein AOL_s00091g12 [Orbilia oligospora ATCC 24927]EGX47268.1 hypothetical protein AOL_s00091g12 [Orbilia oligospora ATCC 24927]
MVEPLALSSFLATLISLSARLAFDIASLRSKYRSVPRELSYLEAECQILASLLANLKSTEPFAYEARNLRPVLCHLNQILIDTSALFGVFDRTPTFLMRIKWIMQKDELVYHRESLSSCLALFNATLISKMPSVFSFVVLHATLADP